LGLHILEQLHRLASDLQLGLELGNPPAGGQQLLMLNRRQPRLKPAVDPVLSPPVGDRLAADPKIPRDVGDLASRLQQVQDPPLELG
jgi:hypothetical protein